jgi:ADP-ribose pyrophosphatase YjhB (NUDIX family)
MAKFKKNRSSTKPKSRSSKPSKPAPKTAVHPKSAEAAIPTHRRHAIEFIARGVLVHNGRVLLCRNPKHGYLFLPGGHVEFGESAAAALRREFLEEAALEVRIVRPLVVSEGSFITKKRWHHEVLITFHVEPQNIRFDMKAVRSQEDDLLLEWADLAAVPDLDVRPPASKALLTTLDTMPAGSMELVTDMLPADPAGRHLSPSR